MNSDNDTMEAALKLNLSDALSPDELNEILSAAARKKISVERLLFLAAKTITAKPKPRRRMKAA